MNEATLKCNTTYRTLNDIIQNKKIHNGYLWQYVT